MAFNNNNFDLDSDSSNGKWCICAFSRLIFFKKSLSATLPICRLVYP